MKISIIVAMDEKRGIGKNGKIPWHIRDDLIRLKSLTKDHVVILGRKTYDSMVWYYNKSGNPMPGRLYIVVTHDKNYKPARENAVVAYSLEEAIQQCAIRHSGDQAKPETPESPSIKVIRDSGQARLAGASAKRARMTMSNGEEVFIIGGGQMFQQALPLANKLYLTIVEARLDSPPESPARRGDFGADTFFPDYSAFKKVISEESKESEGYKYRFLEFER